MPKPTTGVLVQSLLYLGAGLNHFLHPGFYLRIMPDHYPKPAFWVTLSGVAEMAGGAGLLLPATRRVAGLGLCVMLVGFLDVHQFMARHPERFPGVPRVALWLRIPLQGILLAWAWQAARRQEQA